MKTRNSIILGVVVVFTVSIIIYSRHLLSSSGKHTQTVGVNSPAPDFSLTDINGKKLDLASYRGKVVLLDFWATWCAPCQAEIPRFVAMQNQLGPQGLQIVGISLDDDAKPVRDFYAEHNMNYPVAVGDADLAQQYGGILGLPVAFLIDQNGRIVAKHVGETDPAVFEAEIKKLLPS